MKMQKLQLGLGRGITMRVEYLSSHNLVFTCLPVAVTVALCPGKNQIRLVHIFSSAEHKKQLNPISNF
jgi:hypothetical protein